MGYRYQVSCGDHLAERSEFKDVEPVRSFMRSLRLTVSEDDLSPSPAVTRGAILNMRLLPDGTMVELYRAEGDVDALITELDGDPSCLQYEICGRNERECYLYNHCRPDEQLRHLHSILDRHALMVDLPIRIETGVGVTIRIVGPETQLYDAFHAFPETIRANMTIENIGSYVPETPEIRSVLTNRQLEVIEAAIAVGYYATPRTATAADVAERIGCARSTASEHLRNGEARLIMVLPTGSQTR